MKIYEWVINKITGESPIFAMSLVDSPAIEVDFVKLSKESVDDFSVKLSDDDKMIVVGPALIPDKLIYRKNINGEEGYAKMSIETVKEASYLFLKDKKNNEVTIQHEDENKSIFLMESWIIEDTEYDKAIKYGFKDLPIGTWMVSYKVDDVALWDDIKSGKINGFSIEGKFGVQALLSKQLSDYDILANELDDML